MKIIRLIGSAWILCSSILLCTPYDPSTAESVVRIGIRQRLGIWPDNMTVSRTPFTLDSRATSTGVSGSFLFDPQVSSQTSSKAQEQNDFTERSSSYLKPAMFIGGALGATAILIRTDQMTYNTLHSWRTANDPLEDVSPVITNLGDGRASMAIFGGFLAYSYLDNDRSAFQAGKIGLESFFVSGIVTQILKHTFGRERPSAATQSGGRWNGAFLFLNQGSGKRGGYAQFDAFPSGHTATVFAAATTLSEVYRDSPWVTYASYTVASSVAISRVMEQTHWLSDCFVGGLIGYFSAQLVLHVNHSDRPVALLPMYDGEHMGLALNVGL